MIWKAVKILLFFGYVIYAFNFIDDMARQEGIIDALLALFVAILFLGGFYHVLWGSHEDQDAVRNRSSISTKLVEGIDSETTALDDSIHESEDAFYKSEQAERYFEAAEINRAKKKFRIAVDYYSQAISLNPDEDKYYYFRAKATRAALDDELETNSPSHYRAQILEDYNSAININPSESKYYNNRGNILFSIEDFDRAIELNPKESIYYYNRACVKHGLEDFRGSIDDYDRALTLDPSNVWAYNNRAWTKEALSAFDSAHSDFAEAYSMSPNVFVINGVRYNPTEFVPAERPLVFGKLIDI